MNPPSARPMSTVFVDGQPAFRGPDDRRGAALAGQRVRLSQYAWIERGAPGSSQATSAGSGTPLVVRSVRSPLAVEVLTPSAASLLACLASPVTAADAAVQAGVAEPIVSRLIGMLLASGAAEFVPDQVDPVLALRSLTQWSLATALPAPRVTGELARAAISLPSDACIRDALLLWEFHHDGSGRVDISHLRAAPETEHFGPEEYVEYDVAHGGLQVMGTFRGLRPVPEQVDLRTWVAGAAAAPELLDHPIIGALLTALGTPNLVGRIDRGTRETRLLWYLRSPRAFDDAQEILRASGIDERRLGWSALRPLIGGERPMRLVVGMPRPTVTDTPGTRSAPDEGSHPGGLDPAPLSIAVEVFYPPAIRQLPDILAAMGVEDEAVSQVRAFAALPPLTRTVALSPSGITDLQTRRALHVKVACTAAGPTVKTYIETRSRPVDNRALMTGHGSIPTTWEADDLRFHVRSRHGRNAAPFIPRRRPPTIPLLEHLEDPTVVAPGDVPLPRVTKAGSGRPHSAALADLLTSRRSERDWSGPPLTLEQLAGVLLGAMDPNLAERQRRYPSAGDVYETDVVVIADRVDQLPTGAYLYRPGAHALRPLGGDPDACATLLAGAGRSTGGGGTPQALCVLAARFDDLASTYVGPAYALMLKDAGVLMATIALVAADLGVGCVLLGQGDSDAFARATGLDYYLHGSIAELALSTHVSEAFTVHGSDADGRDAGAAPSRTATA